VEVVEGEALSDAAGVPLRVVVPEGLLVRDGVTDGATKSPEDEGDTEGARVGVALGEGAEPREGDPVTEGLVEGEELGVGVGDVGVEGEGVPLATAPPRVHVNA
jgi:hypothetical protein